MTKTEDSATTSANGSELDHKIVETFPGCVVRKDLVGAIKGNAPVPSYVLEYLIGKYAATADAVSIEGGMDSVRRILAENYVHREEANLIQSRIRERGRYSIIDRVQVALNEKYDRYEAAFSNLGISEVVVDSATVKKNPKLLVSGVWCMCTLGYAYSGDPHEVPWRLQKLAPVQMSHDDRENYLAMRARFTTDEWIDLLMQSIGFDPELFGTRAKLLHLVRMVPFVERNYNLVELGPKGTGKSHIYSEFSPHGMLISGGEVTAAKLFVNNASGRIGLVGYWDTVAFDEFAGKAKRADKALVDIMKNYMANKSFSRGVETLQGEASMVFVGNTSHNVPYMLKNSDLFEELPRQYHDAAFLDRIHYYVPGWEFEQIRGEMFTRGYGFVVDYLAEMLHNLRDVDYGGAYERYFALSPTLSTRDKDGIRKTFSGLMELVHPTGKATPEEMETLLRCAIEGRKRVKDQLCRIDPTMAEVDFSYTRVGSGEQVPVHTLEETEYPELYWRGRPGKADSETESAEPKSEETKTREPGDAGPVSSGASAAAPARQSRLSRLELLALQAKPGRREYKEGQIGAGYDKLFGPWLVGAKRIEVCDPYVRKPYQVRNLAEFLETVLRSSDRSEEIQVHLITDQERGNGPVTEQQLDDLKTVQTNYGRYGIILTYEFKDNIHDRFIKTDTGWIIDLGKGLDIYQRFDTSWFSPLLRMPQIRPVSKDFTVNYSRTDQ
ncbi:BREX system Lon protease-like protein BrxL [Bifidobacterium sp. 82T24]|uniref:BREX system Lon protease-like protein BrxL n=1 Tax=Bifidobacterium pluvialisilvae TaxID=2834436 RepID=UPI001C59B7B9|nr:BREX system Lon protease-like protein BrxL [Bifidobacterium pluvialisilvae]MBW3088260.1 BREX system Lon protease-like protein BrxL [Bifidobacterium pluvialisilvae]